MRRIRQKISHRGSMTVEASMIMGMIILVIFLLLQMTMVLTDCLRADALMAEDCTYRMEEEADRNAWFARQGRGFFFLKPAMIQRQAERKKIQVSCRHPGIPLGQGYRQGIDRQMERTVRDPVAYIHKIQILMDVGG